MGFLAQITPMREMNAAVYSERTCSVEEVRISSTSLSYQTRHPLTALQVFGSVCSLTNVDVMDSRSALGRWRNLLV